MYLKLGVGQKYTIHDGKTGKRYRRLHIKILFKNFYVSYPKVLPGVLNTLDHVLLLRFGEQVFVNS